jgi:hypothetical protein
MYMYNLKHSTVIIRIYMMYICMDIYKYLNLYLNIKLNSHIYIYRWNVHIVAFGSSMSTLGSASSDLDLCLVINEVFIHICLYIYMNLYIYVCLYMRIESVFKCIYIYVYTSMSTLGSALSDLDLCLLINKVCAHMFIYVY